LWFDQVAWLLERARHGTVVEIGGLQIRVGDTDSVAELKKHLKRMLPPHRDSFLVQLSSQLGLLLPPSPSDGYEPVAQSEMHEMMRTGLVEICAHTVTHTIATVLPDASLRQELAQCKTELEAFCGREVTSFCYPNGEEGDFDGRTTHAIKDAGFKMALTSVEGNNTLSTVNPYYIHRVHAHRSDTVFEKEVSGLGDIQRRLLGTASYSQ
jgi:peptidoglycan/xylan/chitin deacetylase (PgdA/CDA1 family)